MDSLGIFLFKKNVALLHGKPEENYVCTQPPPTVFNPI